MPDRSVPRLSPPDSGTLPRLHGLYNLPPPVACTWREDTVEGEGPPRGKRLPLECVVKEEHHNLPGPHSQQSRERPGEQVYELPAGLEVSDEDIALHGLVLPTGAHFPPVFWTIDNLLIEGAEAFPSLPTIGQRTRGGGKRSPHVDTTIYRQQRER